MRKKQFIVLFLLFTTACNSSQQDQVVEQKLENNTFVATDFISNGDIVWCQKNYDFFISLFEGDDKNLSVQQRLEVSILNERVANGKAFGGNNEDSEKAIELKESVEILDYLQRSVDLLIPNYNELDYQEVVELKLGLGFVATENERGFDSRYEALETSTSVCSTWKETINS
tara:strand:+ start:120 stop:635 length:516 start_codon:yes stop_codon:yes gene_type:complete